SRVLRMAFAPPQKSPFFLLSNQASIEGGCAAWRLFCSCPAPSAETYLRNLDAPGWCQSSRCEAVARSQVLDHDTALRPSQPERSATGVSHSTVEASNASPPTTACRERAKSAHRATRGLLFVGNYPAP